MKGFKSTSTNTYTYTQSGVWKKGQYTFQAVVLSDSGYAFAFQRSDTTWQTVDLSWQVKDGSYSKIQWTFTLEVDAVAFKLIANTVTGETTVLQPMLEKGTNGSTPIAHEEDLRGMDGDNHEFIFARNTTGTPPATPLSTQDDDYVPEGWTDNAQGVTSEIPFEFVSMRERKNGVWLDFSPPSLWAKWGEDGLSVNLLVEGHYNSHWEGITKVVEIVGGVDVGGNEVVKVSAVFRKGEENIAATVSQSRGFQWHVNGVHLTSFDNQPFITLDETYGDGFADYVVLSYLVNSIREEERREIINISEGMDGIGEEFIFKANNSDTVPPVLPQTTDVGYQNDDYYGQGTANEWNDDPVAPTELNQFVWVAKRKKIGGIWEAFGTPSIWTKWVTDGADAIAPIIIDGFWAFWDETLNDYVQSEFSALGDDGHSPYVDELTGTWFEWNGTAYENTGITAKGEKGDPGAPGADGEPGASIDTVTDYYATSTSGTTAPSTGWQTTMPSKPANHYLWNYEVIAYTDGRTPTQTQKRVIQGKDARSIYDIKNAYAYSASDTVSPTSGWQWSLSALGTKPSGYFLWVREDIAYTDNPSNYISTIGYVVRDGADGTDGADGADGHSPYISGTTGTWWTWDDALGQYVNTGYSPVGSDGAIPYPAGYYDNTKRYRREAEYAPYVQYEGALYLLIKDTPSAGIATSNTTYWKAFNNWEAVFVNSLVASFAKIGGAVFTGNTDPGSPIKGRMISERGVDGTTNFQNYTGDSGTWQPKLMLDFLNGRAKFEDAEVRGKIDATEGELGNLTMKSGGHIDLPPTFTSRKGRLDNEGLSLIYQGNDSQIIEWYDYLGAFAGRITCDSSGKLKLTSSYGVGLGIDTVLNDAITITDGSSFNHSVNMNGSDVSNLKTLSGVGVLNLTHTTHVINANTNYHLSNDTTLIILTSVGDGGSIYRITGSGGASPNNGDVRIIMNTSPTNYCLLKKNVTNSNIKVLVNGGPWFRILQNSIVVMVYYNGYWRIQTDWGQPG